MARLVEDLLDGSHFDLTACVHHDHSVRDAGYHSEVVGDQHDRRVGPVLDPLEDFEDLRLDRHVERGRRFVGDQELGLVGNRHRDHRSLAHASGKLVGVLVHSFARVRYPHDVEEFHAARSQYRFVDVVVMHSDGFGDLAADGVHGIERGECVLEDHRDLFAAHRLEIVLTRIAQ